MLAELGLTLAGSEAMKGMRLIVYADSSLFVNSACKHNRAYPHGTSAKPARGAMRHTSQQSSEVHAAASLPIPTPLKLSLLARAPACPHPRCCCCCPAAVGTPYQRRHLHSCKRVWKPFIERCSKIWNNTGLIVIRLNSSYVVASRVPVCARNILSCVEESQTDEIFRERSRIDLVRCSIAVMIHPLNLVARLHIHKYSKKVSK